MPPYLVKDITENNGIVQKLSRKITTRDVTDIITAHSF